MPSSRGQTLLEFCLVLAAATLTMLGAGRLGWNAWEKLRCRHLAFEAAHHGRVGLPAPRSRYAVALERDPRGVSAIARCGQAREKVTLPSLPYYLGKAGK